MMEVVRKNYPVGNPVIQDHFKNRTLKRINNFKPQFLADKDERYAKHAKPLCGYVTEKDMAKLDKIKELFIKPLTID